MNIDWWTVLLITAWHLLCIHLDLFWPCITSMAALFGMPGTVLLSCDGVFLVLYFFSAKTVCSDVACVLTQDLWLHMC